MKFYLQYLMPFCFQITFAFKIQFNYFSFIHFVLQDSSYYVLSLEIKILYLSTFKKPPLYVLKFVILNVYQEITIQSQ